MGDRKVDITIGDTEVVKHEPDGITEALGLDSTRYTVDGEWYGSREDAIQAAVEKESND